MRKPPSTGNPAYLWSSGAVPHHLVHRRRLHRSPWEKHGHQVLQLFHSSNLLFFVNELKLSQMKKNPCSNNSVVLNNYSSLQPSWQQTPSPVSNRAQKVRCWHLPVVNPCNDDPTSRSSTCLTCDVFLFPLRVFCFQSFKFVQENNKKIYILIYDSPEMACYYLVPAVQ